MNTLNNAILLFLILVSMACDNYLKRKEKSQSFLINEIIVSEVVRGSKDSNWQSFCNLSVYCTFKNNGEHPIILKADESRHVINCYLINGSLNFPLRTSFYLNDTLIKGESQSFLANIPGRELKTLFSQTKNCDSLLVNKLLGESSFIFILNNTDTIWAERSNNFKISFNQDLF